MSELGPLWPSCFYYSVWVNGDIFPPFLPVSIGARLFKERISSYGSKFFPLLTATVENVGKTKMAELLPMKLYPFTLRQNLTVEKRDAFTYQRNKKLHITSVIMRRRYNVYPTMSKAMDVLRTLDRRCTNVMSSLGHGGIMKLVCALYLSLSLSLCAIANLSSLTRVIPYHIENR